LSPIEAIGANAGPTAYPEDDEDYPVPQVTAPRIPSRPASLGNAREKSKIKVVRRSSSKEEDTLPRVASTSTVLAPIGGRTNYVGPALLRSRPMGLKRNSSEDTKEDRSGNSKKVKSGPTCLYFQDSFAMVMRLI
jgi:hypothetical protein